MDGQPKLKNTDGQQLSFFKDYNFDEKRGWWDNRKKQISRNNINFQNSKTMMAERGLPITAAGRPTSFSKAVKRNNYYIIDGESEIMGGGGGGGASV